jgi:hypothetical protein
MNYNNIITYKQESFIMPEQVVNLNISDISDAITVIDHAADQGAFRGWTNIRQIIALRDRLEVFVSAAATATENQTDPVTQ